MIRYTEKLETDIKSELHEGTKWIRNTKQKKLLQKYFTKNSRGYDLNLLLWQSLHINSFPCIHSAPIQWAMPYASHATWFFTLVLLLS